MRPESSTEMSSVRAAVSEFTRALEVSRRVRQHPYATLAAAVGVGYVLGGGLFTRLTARLVRAGGRVGADLAAIPLLAKAVTSLAAAPPPKNSVDGPH